MGAQVNVQNVESQPRPPEPDRQEASGLAAASRSLLLREALARRLSLLGLEVDCFADPDALSRAVRSGRPALVLLDGDGWELPWEALLRRLELHRRGVPALLLVGSLNMAQALEAPSLGVGAVLLKPFKPEEHTARIYDMYLEARAQTARRAHPRYFPADGLELEVLPEGDWVARRLPVLDVSAGGARLRLPDLPAAARLVPGSRWAVASLGIGASRASLGFRVVHRNRHSIGVAFEQLVDRNGAFRETLQGLERQVFGSMAPRRSW